MLPATALLLAAAAAATAQTPGGCDSPPRLTFAELMPKFKNMTDFPIGTVVAYTCRPGYGRFPGRSHFMKCLAHGQWPEVLEFCAQKSCGNPGELHNGRIAITDVKLGATVNYTCDHGYRLIGKSQRRCDISGKRVAWSHEPPICERIPCPRPPDVKHGSHNAMYRDDFSYGSAVIYTCETGYPLTGDSSIYCTTKDGKTGEWSGPGPRCGAGRCPFPTVQNGKRISDYKSSYAYGDIVLFECNPGYIMRGQSSIHCNADNSWDPPVLVCEQVIKCSPPPDIANGRHNAQASGNFAIGIAVLYSCKPGYSLIGTAYAQCTKFGTWSRPLPRCTAIGCTTPAVQNGWLTEIKPAYSPRDYVTVKCDPGYTLSSPRKAQCQVGGTWDPPVPACERVLQCPAPPRIAHADRSHHNLQVFTTGMSVTYECHPGYTLIGSALIYCMASGQWSIYRPRCEVTRCPNPEIRNGRKLEGRGSVYDRGDKVRFECNDDYVLKGSYEIQCQDDGTWAPPAPTCSLVVPCPPPPAIDNGRHTAQGLEAFHTGMSVIYNCDRGYSLFGRGTIHCTESGTWSLPYPRCTNGCGPPPRLRFAAPLEEYATQNSFPIGKIVKYSCQPGYSKKPGTPPSVKCLRSGEWTDTLDFCTRKSCGHPEEPQNGRVIVQSDILFGATVNYTCEEGHRLLGQPQRHCQISGKTVAWSGATPICERIPCLPPPDIEHGSLKYVYENDFSYGSAVTYKCDRGYPLIGKETIYCTTHDGQNGEWSGPPPHCGEFPAHSCPIAKISNGRIVRGFKSTYNSGDTVTITCNNGYIMRGQSKISCQPDNSWRPPVPVCEQVVKCLSPPSIANGKLKGQASDTFVNGTSAFYYCNSGYTLVGKASIQCLASGSWSRPYPQCEMVVCPNPEIQNGRKLDGRGSAYTFGHRVSFVCNAGYVLNGSHEIQCQQDGSWDPRIPSCIRALPCPPPPPVTNARHSAQLLEAFPSGTSVRYSCEPGYALIGKASIHCTASGTWSLPYPACSKSCGVPPQLSFAELWSPYKTQNGFLVGKTVNYTCLPGYFKVPEKPQTVTCLENQTWSEALEFCKRKSCALPEDPENGRVIIIDLLFESRVNYTCNEGYVLVGQLQRHCEVSGKRVAWSGDAPTCQYIKCPQPPDIQHGNHDGHSRDGFYYASVVTYTCSEGYPLTGEFSIHCTTKDGQTGVWSGPAPRCGEVRCPVPQIQNGRSVSGLQQVYTYGDTVTFECDPSYTMRGRNRSRCQSDDTWDPLLPVCEQVLPCPPPPPIANAKHRAQVLEVFPSGTSVSYSCDHGYFLVGEASIHCMESGTWSLPYPVCSGGCGVPPRLSFAELKNSDEPQDNFPIGTTVTYTCRPGYAKIPGMSLSVTCLDTQMWSAAPEICKRKSCGHPEEPRNGRVIIVTDLLFGSTVNYTCEEGYKLTGMPLRRCEISGQRVAWSRSPPECQRIVCPSPPDIHNGTHNGHLLEDFSYGSSIRYTCDPGHPLNGENFLYCTTKDGQTGVWSGPAPRCGEVRCPVPQIQNGSVFSIQQVYTYGDTVTFECDPSFTMHGQSLSRCQPDDSWDPPVPICEPEVQCFPAPTITNGKHDSQAVEAFTSGMSVSYQCDPGYTLIGEAQLHCTASGAWSHLAPRCEEPKCPPPPSIANGNPIDQALDAFNPGSVFLYSCKPGYALVGVTSIQCMASGAWSRPLPRCTVVGCKNLYVDNGRVMGFQDIYRPGDIIVVACDHGYVSTGAQESQCQFGGEWDPPVANCEKVLECPPPPNIANAERRHQAKEAFTPGMSVEYFCDAEYSLVAEGSIFCTAAGTWSLPLPLCEVIRCTNPKIQNGRKLDSRGPFYKPWDVVMLECNAGYSLSGSYEIQCGEDGVWDPPVPTCILAGCEIPKLHNGRILGLKLVYDRGDSVTVECDPGYTVKGTHVSQCQVDGMWDPPVAVCEKVRQCPLPPNITHAEHSSQYVETFTTGMSVNYSCEQGYSLVGEGLVNCTTSGVWSLPLPCCEAVTCPNPEILNGRNLDGWTATYSLGDSVRLECSAGYSLNGSREIVCGEDGAWHPPVPVCSQVTCGSPKVQNGKATGTKPVHNPRDTVTVQCDAGYAVNGTLESQCQDDGTWDPPVLLCERVRQCPLPPNITHAEHSSRDVETFTPGMSVNYSCEPGYSLAGEGSIYCSTSGAWSLPLPLCEAVTCPNPEILNGRNLDEWTPTYSPGDRVRFECSAGYSLNSSHEIQCRDDGIWDPPVPVCNQVTCGSPKVQNGKATGTKPVHNPRDTVTVQCDAGYTVNGTLESQCQDDGTWDPPVLLCERVRQCPLPPNITHAEHSSRDVETFTPGMSVNYSCEPGYSLAGEGSIYCSTSGAWSLPLPLCEAVTCPNPEILNGRNLDEWTPTYSPGDRVRFECSAGYSLNSSHEIQCRDDGIWDPPVPVCYQVTCGSPKVQNGKATGTKPVHNPRDTVTVECDAGYAVNGTLESQCQDDGTWDPPVLLCERVLQCPLPPNITHAEHSSRDVETFTPGISVNYSCEPGYSLVGEGLVNCTTSGVWSLPLPRCEAVTCPNPEILNGRNLDGWTATYSLGDSVRLECSAGYSLNGSREIVCGEDGAWHPPVPVCSQVMCGSPKVQNGKATGAKPVHNPRDTVTVECDAGYAVKGTLESRCQDDGTWDPPVLVCERVRQCPLPPNITHAEHSSRDVETFTPGMSVNYSCEPGYSLAGEGSIYCTTSGAWSLPLPLCEAVTCPNPEILNGRNLDEWTPTYSPGDRVRFECSAGYSLNSSHEIQCRDDGIWDPPVPVCNQVTCGSPKVQNGKATGTKPVHNPRDTVTVQCDAGYAVNGTLKSQCQDDGTWDPPVLLCERVRQCPLPPNITHAEHSSRDVETFTPGMSVNYSCEPGYSLVGDGSINCSTSGAWSLPLPLCEAVTCPNPEILNGRNLDGWTATYSLGDSVRLECSAGYSLNGSCEIVCGEDGAWHPPVPVCSQVTCGSLKVQNGKATGTKPVHNPRDTVTVECDAGYAVNGTLESRCQEDGTWDPPVLVCLRVVFCTNPEIPNGRKLAGHGLVYRPGDRVQFECSAGYSLNGSHEIWCGEDGAWDPPLPACNRELPCSPPPAIANGKHSAQALEAFPSGMSVNYSCDPGYSLVGEASIHCTESGNWSLPFPLCAAIVCRKPEVQNGRILELKPVYNPRDTVTVECDPGYTVNSTRGSRCQDDGTWDPQVLTCEKVPQCPLPPKITHAKHSSQEVETFPPGMSVNYSCEPGYSLVGEGWISCTASGAWSLPLPHCEAITCTNPEIHDGRKLDERGPMYKPGDRVQFECSAGYSLNGSREIQCGEDGAWDPAIPACSRVVCGTPNVPSGRISGLKPVYNPRDTVTVECDLGYAVNGTRESRCQNDGTWDPPVPICKRVPQCPLPPNITHAKHSSQDVEIFPPGVSVNYSCEPGYSLVGERWISCMASGAWSLPLPHCEVLRCPLPPSISNGKLSSQASAVFTPGMSASYSCDPGYTVTGEASISCTESGTWSLPIPQCKGKSCSYPEEPENGTVVLTDLLIGSTVNYSCEEGYRLIGEAQRRCEISDMDVAWSGTEPICEPVMCTTPEIPNGREVDGRGARYTAGHSVSFECNADYILNGSHEIQCQQDGNWDPPIPVCSRVLLCPPPPAVANGMHNAQAQETFPSGMSVNYSCDPGYSLHGEASIHCTESGNWSFPYPLCAQVSVAGCGAAPRAQNGRLTGLKPVYDPGDTVTVECEPDYTVNGTRQSRCRGDGTWDPPVIVCERVLRCPLPPSISNGKLSSQASAVFTPGMSASYSCDPGYTVTGEASISCTESGTWSLPIPQCKGKSCSYPEEPENGTVVLTDLLIGSTVNYSCEEGYRLIGEAQRRCEISDMDVAWSGTEPICEPVMCTTPEIPNGREVDGRGARYTAGHSVSFECNADYILNGSHEIQCQQDGNWDPPIPVCSRVLLCPPPPAVANGMHNAQAQETFPSGMSVNYSCDPGYSLHGEASIHCTESGNWSFPYPLCAQAVICTTPEIPNGRNLDGRHPVYRPGDRVRVECNDIFTLNGIQEIRCMENGTWDPPIPDCSLDQPKDSLPPMKFILKHQCPSPPTIANGKHSGQDLEVFTPGVSVNYSCEPGFSLAGETSIHCTASGTWNQPFPSCKGCAAPPAIANGNRSIQDLKEFAYGSSVTHSCDMGFLLVGEATSQCTSSGTWVPPIPYCKEMRCVVPDVPGIGKAMMGMTYPIGTNLTIQCDDDYMLEGSSLIQCQDDLSWDPSMPVCSSASPSLGSYSAISAVTGVSGTMLLVLLVMGIVWRVASKKKEGYYHTYENYDHPIPMTVITDQKSSFAP